MIAATFLVLACIGAAIDAQLISDSCIYLKIGSTNGYPRNIQKTILQPGTADWEVLLPDIASCPSDQHIGSSAVVCDSDGLPQGTFEDVKRVLVHRTGTLSGLASVTATEYCLTPGQQSDQYTRVPLSQPLTSLLDPVRNQLPFLNNLPQGLLNQAQELSILPQSRNLYNQQPQSLWGQSPLPLLGQPPLRLLTQPPPNLITAP